MSDNYFEDLSISFVGRFRALRNGIFMRRDKLRIGLMTGSNVVKVTQSGTHAVKCPILFFDFTNEDYLWKTTDQESRESYFFDCTGSRAERIQTMLRNDFPQGFVCCHDPMPFRIILDNMSECFNKYRLQRTYQLPLFAEQFLTQIYLDHTMSVNSNKYESFIRDTAKAIFESPGINFDFGLCAKQLGITSIHYRRLFKSVIGLPPIQYQQRCRLSHAIELLKKSKDLQIQQISEICGFNSSSEFSRFFKNQTGFSPAVYCQKFGE